MKPRRGDGPQPDLSYIKSELDRVAPKIPGTGWTVDEATGSVLVIYDSDVTEADLASLQAAAAPFGTAVRFERVAGTVEPS